MSAMIPASAYAPELSHPPIVVGTDPSCVVIDGTGIYVADAYSGAIVRINGEYQRRIATIDSGGTITTNRIGGIAIAPDGTVFATRVGEGQAAAVFRIDPDGHSETLANVPPRVWRGGLVADGDRLFGTQYMRSRSGAFDGSVVEIDAITGTCSNVIDGFLHPTGITKLGNVLVIADARQRAVFRVELAGGRGVFRLQLSADVDRPDSVCACGPDAVLVTSYDDHNGIGVVRRISLDGATTMVAQGSWEPRGIATDGTRAYVATRRGGVLVIDLV